MGKIILFLVCLASCGYFFYQDHLSALSENRTHINSTMIQKATEIVVHCKNVPMGHPDYTSCRCYEKLSFYERLTGAKLTGLEPGEYAEVDACGFTLPPFYEPPYTGRDPLWRRLLLLAKSGKWER